MDKGICLIKFDGIFPKVVQSVMAHNGTSAKDWEIMGRRESARQTQPKDRLSNHASWTLHHAEPKSKFELLAPFKSSLPLLATPASEPMPTPARRLPRTKERKSVQLAKRNMGVISSRLRPLVSGRHKTAKGTTAAETSPKKRSVPPGPMGPAIITGVMKALITLAGPQFMPVHRPTAFPRTRKGMISEMYSQAPKPQEMPKENMYPTTIAMTA
mmetsp:Transcript_33016/g.108407  ORF Transcript_33016/g.108407 Transcript_33016/m.108407 type:complete len:214 (+) Transcript_33016:290-931(+)